MHPLYLENNPSAGPDVGWDAFLTRPPCFLNELTRDRGEKRSLYLHCQLGPHGCVNILKQTLLNSCPPSPISQFHQPTRSDRFRNWPLKSCFIWISTFSADLCPPPIPPSYLPPGFQEDPADFWLMLISLINRMGTYFCKSATVCSRCIPFLGDQSWFITGPSGMMSLCFIAADAAIATTT